MFNVCMTFIGNSNTTEVRIMSTYTPNDSSFGHALTAFAASCYDRVVLDDYDTTTLDEFASCAQSILNTPAYADDEDVRAFWIACEQITYGRFLSAR